MAQLVFERMLISTGKTMYSMVSQGVGGVMNISLDYVLIFGHFGMSKMGIAGAAAATVASQSFAAVIALFLNIRKNKEVQLSLSLRLPLPAMRRLLVLGAPTALIMSLNSLMMVNYNAVLNRFSSTAATVMAVGTVFCVGFPEMFLRLFNATDGMIEILVNVMSECGVKRLVFMVKMLQSCQKSIACA